MNRLRMALLGLAVVFLGLSAVTILVDPSVEGDARPSAVRPDSTPFSPPSSDSGAVERVVSGNLFSKNRQAAR